MTDKPDAGTRPAVLIASLSLNPIAARFVYDGAAPQEVLNTGWPHEKDDRGRDVYQNVTHDPATYYTLPPADGFAFTAEPAKEGGEAALLLFNDTDDSLLVTNADDTTEVLLPGDLTRRLPAGRHALHVAPQAAAEGAPTVTRPLWLPIAGKAYALRYACGCDGGKAWMFQLTSTAKRFPEDAGHLGGTPWQLDTDTHLKDHAATNRQAPPETRQPSLQKAFAAVDAYYQAVHQAFLKERRTLFQRNLDHHLGWMDHRREFLDHVESVSWAA